MRTRWIQKRSLFTTNVKAVGDTCVTAAHGARVCAISLINQNQQRQEVCFSMSGDALTLRSDMAVEYSISKILGRHQNVEYFLILQKLLQQYSKNTSEVLSRN